MFKKLIAKIIATFVCFLLVSAFIPGLMSGNNSGSQGIEKDFVNSNVQQATGSSFDDLNGQISTMLNK